MEDKKEFENIEENNSNLDDEISLRIKELNAEFEAIMKEISLVKSHDINEEEIVLNALKEQEEPKEEDEDNNKEEIVKSEKPTIEEIKNSVNEYIKSSTNKERIRVRGSRLSRYKNQEDLKLKEYKPIFKDEVKAFEDIDDSTPYTSINVHPGFVAKPVEPKPFIVNKETKKKRSNRKFNLTDIINSFDRILNRDEVDNPTKNRPNFSYEIEEIKEPEKIQEIKEEIVDEVQEIKDEIIEEIHEEKPIEELHEATIEEILEEIQENNQEENPQEEVIEEDEEKQEEIEETTSEDTKEELPVEDEKTVVKEEIIPFTPITNRVDKTNEIVLSLNTILNENVLKTKPVNEKKEEIKEDKKEDMKKSKEEVPTSALASLVMAINEEKSKKITKPVEEVKEEIKETKIEKTEEVKKLKNTIDVKKTFDDVKSKAISSYSKIKDDISKAIDEKQKENIAKEAVKHKTKPIKRVDKVKIPEVKIPSGNGSNSRPKAKTGVYVLAIIAVICVIIEIAGIAGSIWFANKLCEGKPEFSPADLDSSDSSIIYDSKGNQIIELGLYLRENVEYENIPNCVVDAFVSIEDSRFFEHFGFDIPRFTKAILENLKTMSFGQGGSTFTMQLVKNSYFQTDDGENSTMAAREGISGIKRKMQEIVLSIEAEQELSKKEIITLYLNKINFGDNIRGVQKAAEYYFGKNADELSLNEAAFLAGIINAPNGNNPYNAAYGNPEYLENANARKNEVLDLMVYHGYITKEEAELNKNVRIENLLAGKNEKFAETNQYYQSFIDAVINEAEKVTGKSPYTTAMNIYTSMDSYMQEYVYNMQNNPEMFKDKYVFRHENQQNALVVLNNQTGELVALGGGRNQANEARQFNRASDAYLNPGSSIKPVIEYALAFDKLGYATSHTVCDRPVFLYETDLVIANAYGQGYTGDMQITEALARSLNTPAIQLLEEVIDKIEEEGVIEYCQSIGLDWCNKDTFDIQWAIGGRDCLVTPVQLAGAHAMLIHNGKYITPHTITRIEYRGKYNETPDYIADTEGTQVISPAAAYMTAYCEQNNVASGWISELNVLRRSYPTFGKTGTTNFSDEAYEAYNLPDFAAKDQWLCTQTSNYTIVIWNGFDKVDENSYFTTTDENYNLKCKMGSILLDAVDDHFNYGPKELEMPDDCIEIEHVLGSFPYIEGSGAKGYISKNSEYATPIHASEYQKEDKIGRLYHMGFVIAEDGIHVHWDEFNTYYDDGTIDLTVTSVSGKKTVFATGRSYFQRYRFINPEIFYCTVTSADGNSNTVESPYPTTVVPAPGEGPYTVCGWTSSSSSQVCSSTPSN